ncbi:uncharacterized protein LOC108865136 [Galendromus occidentalis]|uniref:Uncharacterized protein LOC108865136 n=1 Tax=Galendromus occidentalis TaxID=34638 RepID=A0AAJ7PBH8_9ACAR|nr:uncharacterized protein LOC108865136 [Galendromus occidentalis]
MWKERTRKALYQLHAKVLWKFNRFETTKIQWKATCVPALTYCNTVTVMSNTLRKNIDSAQRQAARWALGEPACNLANEFLKGELGWSTFEEREAKSKITYFKRIQEMPDERWAKRMLTMISINNAKIKAVERMKTLSLKYECDKIVVKRSGAGGACLNTFKKSVEKKIRDLVHQEWRDGMNEKSSLARYRKHKQQCGTIDHIYDNSRGSVLLAQARAGFLRTRKFGSRFEEIDPICRICGQEESLEHVLMACQEETCGDDEIQKRLGLHEESERRVINDTKRILERWERREAKPPTPQV